MLSHLKSLNVSWLPGSIDASLVSISANSSGIGALESACSDKTCTKVVRFVVMPSCLRAVAIAR